MAYAARERPIEREERPRERSVQRKTCSLTRVEQARSLSAHKSYSIYHTLLRTPDVPMLLIRWDASKEGPSSYSQKSNATSQCRGEEDDKRPLRDPMCKRRG